MTKQEITGILAVRAMVQNRIAKLHASTDDAFARFSANCAMVQDQDTDAAQTVRNQAWDAKEKELEYIHTSVHALGLVVGDIDNLLKEDRIPDLRPTAALRDKFGGK